MYFVIDSTCSSHIISTVLLSWWSRIHIGVFLIESYLTWENPINHELIQARGWAGVQGHSLSTAPSLFVVLPVTLWRACLTEGRSSRWRLHTLKDNCSHLLIYTNLQAGNGWCGDHNTYAVDTKKFLALRNYTYIPHGERERKREREKDRER